MMRFRRTLFVAAALLAPATWAPATFAQGAGEKGKQGAEAKARAVKSAATIDFAEALGLNFEGLKGLGGRIEQARQAPDPVCLAVLAAELKAAETVADKRAEIKSSELLHQAATIARLRDRPEELKAVALLSGDKDLAKDLDARAEKAAKRAKSKASETSKGIAGSIAVVNQTRWYVTVYIDGVNVGTVQPFSTASMFVGDPAYGTTTLYAKAPGTSRDWGPEAIDEPVRNFVWTLND